MNENKPMDSTILKSIVTNPKIVDAFFGSQIFNLGKIILMNIEFDYQSPSTILCFEIEDFPKEPPLKWKINQYNRAVFKVSISDISSCTINGTVQDREKVDFKLSGKIGCVKLKISNLKGTSIDIESKWIYIREIKGYRDLSPSLF